LFPIVSFQPRCIGGKLVVKNVRILREVCLVVGGTEVAKPEPRSPTRCPLATRFWIADFWHILSVETALDLLGTGSLEKLPISDKGTVYVEPGVSRFLMGIGESPVYALSIARKCFIVLEE
jgi:hypothetical protein